MADSSPTTCPECKQALPLQDRILAVLSASEPKTARRIWADLGENTTTLMSVRQTARRMRDRNLVHVQNRNGSVQGWVPGKKPAEPDGG